MKALTLTAIVSLLLITGCSRAENVSTIMENFLWQNRIVMVFAPTAENTAYQNQILNFENNLAGLKERDMQIWRFINMQSVFINDQHRGHLSTNPFYEHFNVHKRDFAVIVIGKDGTQKARYTEPVEAATLFEHIDAMPMRQREVQQPKIQIP